jgi:hypothetical protein
MWVTLAAALAVARAQPMPAQGEGSMPRIEVAAAARFAELALDCVHREYPNKISHTMASDEDARPPRELTPAFYGCYDWHSSVHGHWLLARLVRLYPHAPFAERARAALGRSITPENIAGEVRYLRAAGRETFERPYGLAWLLQLMVELWECKDDDAQRWAATLAPLESEVVARLGAWLAKLRYPIRIGEHAQTAFAFGLAWDWAGVQGDQHMREVLGAKAQAFYGKDRSCPLAYEPSGEDFLSPCLAEADLMRRILPPARFASWLSRFMPAIPRTRSARWLAPGVVTDRSDPRLAHIDGLNLSRAWMLEGIASGLPATDARVAGLRSAAAAHRAAALPAVTGEHYAGGHWLGTFATYLLTERGLAREGRHGRRGAAPRGSRSGTSPGTSRRRRARSGL